MNDRPRHAHLSRERARTSSWRAVVVTVVVAVLVTLSINALARVYLTHYSGNRTYWIVGASWRRLEALPSPLDWMLVGDSGCAIGIVPEVLETELGGRAWNLCTVQDLTLFDDALMLDRALELGHRPRAVIVSHVPVVWVSEPLVELIAQVPRPLWVAAHPLTRRVLAPARRVEVLVKRWLPLYSEDQTLRGLLFAPSTWFRSPFDLSAGGFVRVSRAFPEPVREAAASETAAFGAMIPRISDGNRASLEHLLRRASDHRIPVIFVSSPLFEGFRDAPGFIAYRDAVRRQLEEIIAPYPDARIVTATHYYPAEVMENPVHLLPEAAEVYTRELAVDLRASLNGDGLVGSAGSPRPALD